jgi:putative hydrolase of the HAD superfamily
MLVPTSTLPLQGGPILTTVFRVVDMLRAAMSLPQVLIIDGDDTLWENNIYFEQSIEDFIDFLDHSTLTRAQVREALDQVEQLNTGRHGYGSAAFARNLRQTYEQLVERAIDQPALDHLMSLARRITEAELVLLPDVRETLDYLKQQHRLVLFTKGEVEEQRLKVQRSGLLDRFDAVVITKEKDVAAYRTLLAGRAIDPSIAWMVGNSPRSDVNPALQAGLGAVYIPHSQTWRLEQAEVRAQDGQRLLILNSFRQLRDYF